MAVYDYASSRGTKNLEKTSLASLLDEGVDGLLEKSQNAVLYKDVLNEAVKDHNFMKELWPYLAVFTKDLNKPLTRG